MHEEQTKTSDTLLSNKSGMIWSTVPSTPVWKQNWSLPQYMYGSSDTLHTFLCRPFILSARHSSVSGSGPRRFRAWQLVIWFLNLSTAMWTWHAIVQKPTWLPPPPNNKIYYRTSVHTNSNNKYNIMGLYTAVSVFWTTAYFRLGELRLAELTETLNIA